MTSLARRRAAAQLLHRPAGATPASVVRHQLVVQAQDYRCARMALRARTRRTTTADVDRALSEDRSVVITWLNRGTLHLVDREDYPWMLGLTAPTLLSAVERRLERDGVSRDDADRAGAVIDRALADEGPLTRHELGRRLEEAGLPIRGGAVVQVLFRTGVTGMTIRGPVVDSLQRYVRPTDWLDAPAPPTTLAGEARDRALAELARRYLRGHGPAADRDLATWAGLPLRDARAGLSAIAGDLVDAGGGHVDIVRTEEDEAPARIPPRLVPMWDEMLVGWRDRTLVVPADRHDKYTGGVPPNGMLRAIVVVGGRAVGTWSIRRERGAVDVEVTPFAADGFSAATAAGIEREVADLARFEAPSLR
jgi:hypothetical protein